MKPNTPMTPMTRIAALPLLALLLAALAGCWPGSANHNTATGSKASLIDQDRKYAQCMRDHGVDMPDPKPGGASGLQIEPQDTQKVSKAEQACRRYAPNGGDLPKPKPEDVAKLRGYAQCMRDHGVPDFPDQDSNGQLKIDSAVVKPGPTLDKAMEACQKATGFGGMISGGGQIGVSGGGS